jgi:hypothetical protein
MSSREMSETIENHVPSLRSVAQKTLAVCEKYGWSRDWSRGGCYLHLEVSEFIEALRGKGDSTKEAEAVDVLFVFLSMLVWANIDPHEVLKQLDSLCEAGLGPPNTSN